MTGQAITGTALLRELGDALYQFEPRQSDDIVKTDLELTCRRCNEVHGGPVMTGPRVRWRPGACGDNLLGYVGTLPSWAFQIFSSGDPAEGRKMIAQLPGMSGVVARDPDVNVLMGEAEGWLVGFVASVGAVFRDTTRPGPAGDPGYWDEPDDPDESAAWDPGDEADDQGGASERRYLVTEDDRERG